MIKNDPILKVESKDLFAGPIKLQGMNYLMYVARDSYKVDVEENDNDELQIEEFDDNSTVNGGNVEDDIILEGNENHNIPVKSPSKSCIDPISKTLRDRVRPVSAFKKRTSNLNYEN